MNALQLILDKLGDAVGFNYNKWLDSRLEALADKWEWGVTSLLPPSPQAPEELSPCQTRLPPSSARRVHRPSMRPRCLRHSNRPATSTVGARATERLRDDAAGPYPEQPSRAHEVPVKKLIRNMKDPASRLYWERTLEIARAVNEMPAWQRNGFVVTNLDGKHPTTASQETQAEDEEAMSAQDAGFER